MDGFYDENRDSPSLAHSFSEEEEELEDDIDLLATSYLSSFSEIDNIEKQLFSLEETVSTMATCMIERIESLEEVIEKQRKLIELQRLHSTKVKQLNNYLKNRVIDLNDKIDIQNIANQTLFQRLEKEEQKNQYLSQQVGPIILESGNTTVNCNECKSNNTMNDNKYSFNNGRETEGSEEAGKQIDWQA